MAELPRSYRDFREDFPDLVDAFDALSAAAHENGPLDERTRRLIKLGIAVGGRLEGAVRSAARQCRDSQVSAAEMDQVVALSVSTIGLPSAVSGRTWMRDELAHD